jgi:hypothetical protein
MMMMIVVGSSSFDEMDVDVEKESKRESRLNKRQV